MTAILLLLVSSLLFLSQASSVATYLHPSLHGNRAGCPGHTYNRHDPTYLAAPPARYATWPCGTLLLIEGPVGSILATRQDSCPGCGSNHVDLSEAGFQEVCGPLSLGRCRVTVTAIGDGETKGSS